ncbi:DUF4139 domain-containing protein [Spongiivirga citrea]|uniref:Mucoidy inhibitor MuiA family protein n=1 Tax=Spongiivirga citrea TaxID=1481457 RepID=A0A6M0CLS2_9FLAO|nr:DUF4139 domain-containing protein [Spongiivirga citrea]NER18885.1 mucoidy inhibitor MuiA family protein [Spongiivirga citrea]
MRQLLLIIFLGVFTNGYCQEKTVATTPTDVTVYLRSAKVAEQGKVSLLKGKNTLKIKNLSNYIDSNTYQIGLSNGATLLSVTPATDYLKADEFTDEEKELINQKETLQVSLEIKQATEKTLAGELNLIEENRKIGNNEQGWTSTQLANLADFYAKRTLEIHKKRIGLKKEISDLKKKIGKINKQLQETSSQRNENRQVLTLEVEASRNTTATLLLTYVVNNAGWQPYYDIRAKSLEDPLSLVVKGKIYQNTGKDWNQVAMKVSTYLPKANQNRPILNPFFIREQPMYNRSEDDLEEVVMEAPSVANSMQMRKGAALADVAVTQVVEQQFNVAYELNSPQSIASTGKGQTIILDKKEVAADYVYHSVPKLTEEVFLLANIKNWQSLNLMLTEANIYFEGNFIGKTTINPNYTKDKYPLSLGVDERIVIKRRLLDNLSSKRTLSSKKVDNFAYEMSIRNNGPKAIELEILDQLPISQNNKIEVGKTELAGGDYDKGTGSILWKKSIARGGTEKIQFSYEVKYPKEMVLQYY